MEQKAAHFVRGRDRGANRIGGGGKVYSVATPPAGVREYKVRRCPLSVQCQVSVRSCPVSGPSKIERTVEENDILGSRIKLSFHHRNSLILTVSWEQRGKLPDEEGIFLFVPLVFLCRISKGLPRIHSFGRWIWVCSGWVQRWILLMGDFFSESESSSVRTYS